MIPVQFLAVILIILVLIKTIVDFKKNKITPSAFLFWLTLWLVILVVVVLPQVTVFLAMLLGIGRGMDVAVYFSILFIFFILFKIIARLEKMKQEITKIVQEDALQKGKFKKNNL